MIKKFKFRLLTIGCALLAIVLLVLILPKKSAKTERNTYYLTAELRNDHTLTGTMRLHYVNTEDFTVSALTFCLYPNAFRQAENVVAQDFVEKAYPHGFSEGRMIVREVKVNGKNAAYTLEENEQFLKVALDALMPDKTTTIEFSFKDMIPESEARFGWGEHSWNLGGWYPMLCPFENGTPVKNAYTPFGDPFYSECADYVTDITAPQTMRLAVTGKIDTGKSEKMKQTWHVEQENIRDFSFTLSKDYHLKSKKCGQTLIYAYTWENDEITDAVLQTAVNALTVFSEIFGEYPYETFTVAEADFYHGGMEYPTLALIGKNALLNIDSLTETVVHETAHQWFYGLIGSDQTKNPWLDEGLAQYATALYYEKTAGEIGYRTYIKKCENYAKLLLELTKERELSDSTAILRPLTAFDHWMPYEAFCYDIPVLMLDALRGLVGKEALVNGLRTYVQNHCYDCVTTQIFLKEMSAGIGRDISTFVLPWLYGNVSL